MPPVAAKGKSEPVAAWLAKAPVSRTGVEVDRDKLTPFVGRELELSSLRALFEKAVSTSSPQFALIVGEPGIGKSRLVQELFAYVDSRPEMTTWRQGRCLSYGEGVTFSALAEIIKAQAGILETDDAKTLAAKLDAVVPEGADRAWLANACGHSSAWRRRKASREENFTAWRRIVESLAVAVPLVVVLEDLHWADDGLLAFVEHLATHAAAAPLLMLGTARPELFERHPAFAAGGRSRRVGVGPLSEEPRSWSPAFSPRRRRSADRQIVERCEATPSTPRSRRGCSTMPRRRALPDSVQAVIAARLDAFRRTESLLPTPPWSATCSGTVQLRRWHGARQRWTACLRELVDAGLVRRVRESSTADESEYAFVHALVRDVAYFQMPRRVRARKHAAAAAWIEAPVARPATSARSSPITT